MFFNKIKMTVLFWEAEVVKSKCCLCATPPLRVVIFDIYFFWCAAWKVDPRSFNIQPELLLLRYIKWFRNTTRRKPNQKKCTRKWNIYMHTTCITFIKCMIHMWTVLKIICTPWFFLQWLQINFSFYRIWLSLTKIIHNIDIIMISKKINTDLG